jgi:hypothetical protein
MKTTAEPTPAQASPLESLFRVVGAWDRFWFSPADPATLGLIRIAAGLIMVYVHFAYSFGLLSYIGPEGWVNENVVQFVRYKMPINTPGLEWDDKLIEAGRGHYYWSIYYDLTDPFWIWVVHFGVLGVLVLFTLGLWTRITSVLTWIAMISYIHRAPTTLFGMDTMMSIVTLYLMIGPSGAAYSLDRLLARRHARRLGQPFPELPEPMVSANFAIRLMQIHFCIVYLASGTSKLLGSSWWSGTAPSLVLLNYSFAPFYVPAYVATITWLAQHRLLWELIMAAGVIFTMFVEIGFPFLVWNKHTRWLMIAGSVMLHTQIGLLMGLTTFSLMMLAFVLAFVPPPVVRQVLGAAGDWTRRRLQAWIKSREGTKAGSLVLTRS